MNFKKRVHRKFTLAELQSHTEEEKIALLLKIRDEIIETIFEYQNNGDMDLVNLLNILLLKINVVHKNNAA